MPTIAQKQQMATAHAKGQELLAEKRTVLVSETATSDVWDSLQAAKSHIEELEQLLADKDMECCRLQSELNKSNQKLQTTRIVLLFGRQSMRKHIMSFVCSGKQQSEGKTNWPDYCTKSTISSVDVTCDAVEEMEQLFK